MDANRMQRLMAKCFGPSLSAIAYRRAVERGESVKISWRNGGIKHSCAVSLENETLIAGRNGKIFATLPFVPVDEIDKEYEQHIGAMSSSSELIIQDNEDLLNRFHDRFPDIYCTDSK